VSDKREPAPGDQDPRSRSRIALARPNSPSEYRRPPRWLVDRLRELADGLEGLSGFMARAALGDGPYGDPAVAMTALEVGVMHIDRELARLGVVIDELTAGEPR